MSLTGGQLRRLIENEDNAYIRCAGFLFIRFGLSPEHHWSWLGEYLLDDQEFSLSSREPSAGMTTIGEYVEGLLTQDHYYSAVLPRLPMAVKKHLETRLAQVPQDRKRTKANRRLLDVFGEKGVQIEACTGDGEWREGEVVELLADSSRPKVRMRFEGGDEEGLVHLGRVIVADSRYSSRSGHRNRERGRSRSRSVDWSRERGKSTKELLDEHRRREQDKAVCSSGKEYSRRPVSFQVALPREMGNASKSLIESEEGDGPGRRGRRQESVREKSPEMDRKRKREEDDEYKARMKQLYEKYGTAKAPQDAGRRSDLEGPDVMRFG